MLIFIRSLLFYILFYFWTFLIGFFSFPVFFLNRKFDVCVWLIWASVTNKILKFTVKLDYEIKGSKRWFKIAGLSIQPSEFIKPFFLILSAWFLSKGIEGRKIYLNILFLFFIIIAGLIILQPDFGMTFLFFLTF